MTNYPRGRLSPRGRLAAQQLRDRKDAVVSAGADVMKKLLVRQRIKLGIVQVKVSCLEGADCELSASVNLSKGKRGIFVTT